MRAESTVEAPRKAGREPYGWRGLAGDASGGAIAALIALPYGLAMARLMGLPPALGLFTSIATAPITALLGRNPVLIGGTASATVPFLAAAVQSQGVGGSSKVVLAASVILMGCSACSGWAGMWRRSRTRSFPGSPAASGR